MKNDKRDDRWTLWATRFWGLVVPGLLCILLYQDFADDGQLENGVVLIPAIMFFAVGQTAWEIWRKMK